MNKEQITMTRAELKSALWQVLLEQDAIVNNQNIDYYIEKAYKLQASRGKATDSKAIDDKVAEIISDVEKLFDDYIEKAHKLQVSRGKATDNKVAEIISDIEKLFNDTSTYHAVLVDYANVAGRCYPSLLHGIKGIFFDGDMQKSFINGLQDLKKQYGIK